MKLPAASGWGIKNIIKKFYVKRDEAQTRKFDEFRNQ